MVIYDALFCMILSYHGPLITLCKEISWNEDHLMDLLCHQRHLQSSAKCFRINFDQVSSLAHLSDQVSTTEWVLAHKRSTPFLWTDYHPRQRASWTLQLLFYHLYCPDAPVACCLDTWHMTQLHRRVSWPSFLSIPRRLPHTQLSLPIRLVWLFLQPLFVPGSSVGFSSGLALLLFGSNLSLKCLSSALFGRMMEMSG